MIRGLERSASTPPSREGKGTKDWVMASDFVSHRYILSLHKNPKGWGLGSFHVGELIEIWGEWDTCRAWKLCVSSHILHSKHFFHLTVGSSFNNLCNKPLMWASLANWSNPKRELWQPWIYDAWIYVLWSEAQVTAWTCDWLLKWESVLWDWALNLWNVLLSLGRQCQNWVEL